MVTQQLRLAAAQASLALILALAFFTAAVAAAAAAKAPAVQTRVTNGGVTQLGQRVTIVCYSLRPSEVVMVKLLKRPLTGGKETEVFAASGNRGTLRPPWNTRKDVTFTASNAALAINMTLADEGSYICAAVTLDGNSDGGPVQLLLALAPTTPQLFLNNVPTPAVGPELLAGQTIWLRCLANVGKPAGTLELLDMGKRISLKGEVRTWTAAVSKDSAIQSLFTSVSTTVRIDRTNHGTKFGCVLKPHQMFARMNFTRIFVSGAISVLFQVEHIQITPFRDNYFHGDRIECKAEGRPAPRITWIPIQGAGTLRTNGSWLYLQPGAKTGYYAYTCSAINLLRGTNHKLLQSIGFHLRHRTLSLSTTVAPPGRGIPVKVKHWVTKHHRGISVFLITFGVICGFALVAVVFAYLYSTAYGSTANYNRLRGSSQEDRMRFYGEVSGSGGAASGGYGDSSDEDDSSQPLNKAKDTNNTNWIGTPIVSSRK